MSDNPVVHFELPYDDGERMQAFYQTAFGWTMVPMGPEMGNYVIAQTAETDADGMIEQKGAINGGLTPRSESYPGPSLVLEVRDLDAAMVAVRDAGGAVVGEPAPIPGVGTFVQFTDTEGNRLGMMQPEG